MVNPTELEIFYRDFHAKALVLVNPTELEIFYHDFHAKALVLVNSTELEIFYRDFHAKALVLVNPDASTERLLTVSSPYMVKKILLKSSLGPYVAK